MNDTNFWKDTIDAQSYCVVQPLIKVATRVNVKAGDELLISYNYAK